MARNSAIEWTDHTFNPWWGCTKVSPACDHCYAEVWAKRTGHSVWGPKAPRRQLTDNYWNEPLRWERAAESSGRRPRVFCASMADVFEWDRDLDPQRDRLWALVERTPNLDWLLLTKRPHLARRLTPWGTDNVICQDEQEARRPHVGRPDVGRTPAWVLRPVYSAIFNGRSRNRRPSSRSRLRHRCGPPTSRRSSDAYPRVPRIFLVDAANRVLIAIPRT